MTLDIPTRYDYHDEQYAYKTWYNPATDTIHLHVRTPLIARFGESSYVKAGEGATLCDAVQQVYQEAPPALRRGLTAYLTLLMAQEQPNERGPYQRALAWLEEQ